MVKSILKFFLGMMILPLSILGAGYFLDTRGFFNLEKIDVGFVNFADQPRYLKPLEEKLLGDLASLKGQSLWKIHISELRSQFEKLPWVEEVEIARKWPSTISMQVRVREVQLLLANKNGLLRPVVREGELLPAVSSKDAPDVPILEGDIFEKKIEMRRQAILVNEEIPKEGSFSRKAVSEIHYDSKNGFWMTLIKNGMQVKMGQEQIKTKSMRVSQVLDYLDSRQIDARVIDANLSKKVLVRLRKDP